MLEESDRRNEVSDVIPMFPTLVWKVELHTPLSEAINAKALAELSHMRQDRPPLARGAGWQSIQTLHELDDFQDLVSCVRHTVTGILRFLQIGYDAFEITACWPRSWSEAPNIKCITPNDSLSGVYDVRTHAGADTINPRNQTGVIRPPVVQLTAENTDQVVVRVKDGTLLLFPSWLRHSVDANTSEAERISISFNVMFASFTENLSKPLW